MITNNSNGNGRNRHLDGKSESFSQVKIVPISSQKPEIHGTPVKVASLAPKPDSLHRFIETQQVQKESTSSVFSFRSHEVMTRRDRALVNRNSPTPSSPSLKASLPSSLIPLHQFMKAHTVTLSANQSHFEHHASGTSSSPLPILQKRELPSSYQTNTFSILPSSQEGAKRILPPINKSLEEVDARSILETNVKPSKLTARVVELHTQFMHNAFVYVAKVAVSFFENMLSPEELQDMNNVLTQTNGHVPAEENLPQTIRTNIQALLQQVIKMPLAPIIIPALIAKDLRAFVYISLTLGAANAITLLELVKNGVPFIF